MIMAVGFIILAVGLWFTGSLGFAAALQPFSFSANSAQAALGIKVQVAGWPAA
jgi:hypothetical protein